MPTIPPLNSCRQQHVGDEILGRRTSSILAAVGPAEAVCVGTPRQQWGPRPGAAKAIPTNQVLECLDWGAAWSALLSRASQRSYYGRVGPQLCADSSRAACLPPPSPPTDH